MEKKKMCRYANSCGIWLGDKRIQKIQRKKECPKNTNSRCEIIPKPSKVERVKAWAWRGKFTGQLNAIAFTEKPKGGGVYPCTILIDEKYLGRKK